MKYDYKAIIVKSLNNILKVYENVSKCNPVLKKQVIVRKKNNGMSKLL